MRIAAYYIIDGELLCRVISSEHISQEMDEIAEANKLNPTFRWVPERPLQDTLLAAAADVCFIDPLVAWEPFRRAVIYNQEAHRGDRK
jgi:hypothetical protein